MLACLPKLLLDLMSNNKSTDIAKTIVGLLDLNTILAIFLIPISSGILLKMCIDYYRRNNIGFKKKISFVLANYKTMLLACLIFWAMLIVTLNILHNGLLCILGILLMQYVPFLIFGESIVNIKELLWKSAKIITNNFFVSATLLSAIMAFNLIFIFIGLKFLKVYMNSNSMPYSVIAYFYLSLLVVLTAMIYVRFCLRIMKGKKAKKIERKIGTV